MDLLEVVTQRQLAALLGISEGRVSQLVSDGGIPAGAPVGAQVGAYCEGGRSPLVAPIHPRSQPSAPACWPPRPRARNCALAKTEGS